MTQHPLLFTVEASRQGDAICIQLAGELDLLGVPVLDAALQRAADQGVAAITLDIGGLTFCDLTGQRALLRAAAAGARLVGVAPRCLERLCELTAQRDLLPRPAAVVAAHEPSVAQPAAAERAPAGATSLGALA